MEPPKSTEHPDWIIRVYSEDGHIRYEHVIKNLSQVDAASKAQEWADTFGYIDFILEKK
jgi:hypothetical protein